MMSLRAGDYVLTASTTENLEAPKKKRHAWWFRRFREDFLL